MSKRRKDEVETGTELEGIAPPEPDPTPPTPIPLNRIVKSGMVKVRALSPIGEPDARGNMQRYAKGDEFEVTESRANALAGLTTRA